MEKLHDDEFKKADCLQCANCCKTTSPIFTNKDIARISKAFRIKTRQFIDTYLNVDADQDYVLKSSPCTFLADDNTCNIYDIRPKACREYPHTNRKNFEKIACSIDARAILESNKNFSRFSGMMWLRL
jgi:hypothetical protein